MHSTQYQGNQAPMAVGIGNKLNKALKQSTTSHARDIQRQKTQTATNSAYSTNYNARSSQALSKNISEKSSKRTPTNKSPVGNKQLKSVKSAYVSQSSTVRQKKIDYKSPINNTRKGGNNLTSTRNNTQSIQESQIVPEDRERLINFSMSMSRIEQQHESPMIDGSMVQAIDKQFSQDQNELNNILKLAINQNMTQSQYPKSDQFQIGFSASQPPLEPEPAHFFTDLSRLADMEDETGMDTGSYSMLLQNAEQLSATVQHLDWQLNSSKHALRKYKDLVVAQQLRINAQSVKLGQYKLEAQKAREAQAEAETELASNMSRVVINKEVQEQLEQQKLRASKQSSSKGDVTPEKLGTLLTEVNAQLNTQIGREATKSNTQSDPIDMLAAKQVMKGMDRDQQNLVEMLLKKLKQEQKMRLQSEEQHEQMMDQMGVTQNQLEQQIRMYKQSKVQGPSAPSSQSGVRIETEENDVGSTIIQQTTTNGNDETMQELQQQLK